MLRWWHFVFKIQRSAVLKIHFFLAYVQGHNSGTESQILHLVRYWIVTFNLCAGLQTSNSLLQWILNTTGIVTIALFEKNEGNFNCRDNMKQSGQEGYIAAMNHRLICVSWYWGDCTMWWRDLSALCAGQLVKIIFKWRRHVFHWKLLPGIMCINTLTDSILLRTRLHPSVESLGTIFNRTVDRHRCNLQLNYCTDS